MISFISAHDGNLRPRDQRSWVGCWEGGGGRGACSPRENITIALTPEFRGTTRYTQDIHGIVNISVTETFHEGYSKSWEPRAISTIQVDSDFLNMFNSCWWLYATLV